MFLRRQELAYFRYRLTPAGKRIAMRFVRATIRSR
jgi:hypothetical protein